MLHVGICAGGAGQPASLPRPLRRRNPSADSGAGIPKGEQQLTLGPGILARKRKISGVWGQSLPSQKCSCSDSVSNFAS